MKKRGSIERGMKNMGHKGGHTKAQGGKGPMGLKQAFLPSSSPFGNMGGGEAFSHVKGK